MSFKKTVLQYCSTNDKTDINYYIYEPVEKEPKAVLQIVHGMCEYIERYEDFAAILCDAGIVVCGNDHLGHGTSAFQTNNLGYFGRDGGAGFLVGDVKKLTVLMKRKFSGLPYFILGHSMGSFVTRSFIVKYPGLVDGAILMGTSGTNKFAKLGLKLCERLIQKKGARYVSEKLHEKIFGSYNKKFAHEGSPNAWISSDANTVYQYDNDFRCNFKFTVSAYKELFTLLSSVSESSWYSRVPKDLPILLVSGGMDPVGNFSKGVTEVYEKLRAAGVKNVLMEIYDDDRHEVLNEKNRQEVYKDIVHYLIDKIEKQPPIIEYN